MPISEAVPLLFSIIIPVRNSADYLRACLEHLSASNLRNYEIIVVDDESVVGEIPRVIADLAEIRYERLDRQSGPSAARNRGARLARGKYLVFLDADVCVHPCTLQVIADTFANNPKTDAVFGSYDTEPSAPNLISQFRNLLHHFVHQRANPEASTFWAGCGAIKREVFLDLGGFSEEFGRPCIEDIELGMRAVTAGFHFRLNRDVQAKHLKWWSLVNMVKTDTRDRGIPWTRLMLERSGIPNDLNVQYSQRFCTVFVFALMAIGLWWTWLEPVTLLLILSCIAGVVGVELWSQHNRRRRRFARHSFAFASGVFVCLVVAALVYLHSTLSVSLFALLVVGIVALNHRLYAFFLRNRTPYFVAAVLPIHILYYLECGVSLSIGILLHFGHSFVNASGPISAGPLPPLQAIPSTGMPLFAENLGVQTLVGNVPPHS